MSWLLLLTLPAAFAQEEATELAMAPELALVADDADLCVPLGGGQVLLAVMDETYTYAGHDVLDLATGERQPWTPDWRPEDDGWQRGSPTLALILAVSPDRQWVCYDEPLMLPPEYAVEYDHWRYVSAAVLCRADGSEARPVALLIEAGGGPQYAFTSDGTRLIGQPMFGCEPTPASYVEYMAQSFAGEDVPQYNYYDLETRQRGFQEGLDIADGFWKCPYSDNFRIENNWYGEHRFSNFQTGGVLGDYSVPGEDPWGWLPGWVLQDALLLRGSGGTGLLYVDGRFVPAPQDGWDVYCWLPDGTYIFSDDDGESIKHGRVDWSSFSVDWWVEHPELVLYSDCEFFPLPDSSGVLVLDWMSGILWYAALSREGARP